MKRNKFIILITLILLVTAGVLLNNESASSLGKNSSAFAVRDTASIVKVFLADKNNRMLTLDRQETGWLVNQDKKANQSLINSLLGTMRKVKVLRPVDKPSREGIIRNLSAQSTKVEIYTEDFRIKLGKFKMLPYVKLAKVFYVGQPTMDSQGTYMLLENADFPCITYIPSFRGYLSGRFDADARLWREFNLFRENPDEIKEMYIKSDLFSEFNFSIKQNQNSFELLSLGETFKSQDIDTIKMYNYLHNFRDIRFEALLNDKLEPAFIDSVLRSKPLYEVNISNKDGNSNLVKFFSKNHIEKQILTSSLHVSDFERMYAWIKGNNDFVLVQQLSVENVFHPKSYFLKNKSE